MKHFKKCFLITTVLVLWGISLCNAQQWNYLDVEEGYETLNIAVAGDTTANGTVVDYDHRVYRLKRGGTYGLNGSIKTLKGAPLRIFAEEGTGPKPVIIMVADETGASKEFADISGDAHFKNIYICGVDNLGNYSRYGMRLNTQGAKLVLDGVQIDGAYQAHVRTYGADTKIFFINCEFRNGIDQNGTGNGRFFDSRGLQVDTVYWQNNTFYCNVQRVFRMDGAIVKNVIFDHNTFLYNSYGGNITSGLGDKLGSAFETGNGVNVTITNNIFKDVMVEGLRHLKTLEPADRLSIIHVDSLESETYPESSRKYIVRNNAYGWSPEFKEYWASKDTVYSPEFIGPYGRRAFFTGTDPNFTESNNFEEVIQFTNAPSITPLLNYVKHRFDSNFNNVGNPDWRADGNGVGSLDAAPGSFGPEANPFTFAYATTHTAYTAGDNGFPLGDLNWFPDKKNEWISTDVDDSNDLILTNYELEQNYPNPFNPTTIISYSLPKSTIVSLTIYNSLGQEIVRLLDSKEQHPGKHSLTWNGKDASGNLISTGVYYYQLRTNDNLTITKKMLLIK